MNEPVDPAETDTRDERLAAALAVPPLDEVTRRRLVREALERPVPRPSRILAAASVAAALAVGGVLGAVLVTGPQQSDTTTAQRAPTASAEADSGRGAAPESLETMQGGEKAAAAPVTSLGELGDVTRPADLRDAIDVAFERSAGPSTADEIVGYPCAAHPAERFGLVATNALALGTYDGAAATVMIGTSPAGESLAVVVNADACTVLASVPLGKG